MEIKNLKKSSNGEFILNDISMNIASPGLYVISGSDDSSRSAILNIISGMDTEFEGIINENNGVHLCGTGENFFQNLTLRENIILNFGYRDNDLELLKKFEVDMFIDRKIKFLSEKQKVLCELYICYILDPSIILIKNPTAFLSEEIYLEYLKLFTEKSIIIVVSYRDIFLNESKALFEIKDAKINCLKNKIEGESKFKCKSIDIRVKFPTIVRLVIKNNLKSYFLNWFILSIITLSIIGGNILLFTSLSNTYYQKVGSYNENTIRVSINEFNNSDKLVKQDKINFSTEDLELIKEIEGVSEAFLYSSEYLPPVDENNNFIDLEYKNQLFEFGSLKTPIGGLEYYNPNNIVIKGQEPELGNNEIVIPSEMCIYLNAECESLLNKKIELPIIGESGNSTEEYFVTGYYNSKKDVTSMNYIYTPYMDEIVIPQVEQKINFESMDKSSEFYDPKIFSSFETYMKAYGSGISSIIIQSEPGKENMIKDYVVSIFPFASATTYEELKDEELSNRNMKLASYIRYEVVIFMIVFLLYFLFSKKFKAKSRKLKLNLVHYKISDIKTIIFIEILIKSCVVFTPLSILMVITDNISIFSIVGTVFYIIIFVLFSYYSDIKYLQRNQYNGK